MSPGIIKIKSRSLTNTENRDTSSLIAYQVEMEKVVRLVNRVADSALFGTKKKERAFQSMHETDLEKGARSLKVSWYEDTASSTTTCTPSVIYGAHTDYEAWTVLAPDPNDREGGRGVGWSPPHAHARKKNSLLSTYFSASRTAPNLSPGGEGVERHDSFPVPRRLYFKRGRLRRAMDGREVEIRAASRRLLLSR